MRANEVMSEPSESHLLDASHHLFYEIWMFYESARFLKRDIGTDVVSTNAHLESFAVHGRVLLSFFYSEAEQDDVIARHYIKNWENICPPIPEKLKKIRFRVGKEVAHLTYSRLHVTPEAKGWDVSAEQEMHQIVEKFQENVPKNFVIEKLLQLRPIGKTSIPVPTRNASPFYATNTSTWVYEPK